jgi:hypothetical protein
MGMVIAMINFFVARQIRLPAAATPAAASVSPEHN